MQVVITGTSRGIGLALTRIALEAGHHVLAVARQPASSAELAALGEQHGTLQTLAADVADADAATAIAGALGGSQVVDLLINNAGILREAATREDFMASYAVNAVAPFEVTQALLPRLRAATNPRVVHITSKMGSLTENTSGGHYAYRSSKAALNMINRTLARDEGWLTAVVVHPGWVQTSMGGPGAPVSVTDSARGIWRLAEGLKRSSSGSFFDYGGQMLPW